MDPKEQMEIIKWAIANEYKGSVVELINQRAKAQAEQQAQQQAQQTQMQDGGFEVAETEQEQEEGLRNKPEGTKMMFPDSDATEFNTVGMDYPIDIKKYDRGGNLVKSYESVPPGVDSLPMGPNPGTILETPAEYQKGGFLLPLSMLWKLVATPKSANAPGMYDLSKEEDILKLEQEDKRNQEFIEKQTVRKKQLGGIKKQLKKGTDVIKALNWKDGLKATVNPKNWFDGKSDFYRELVPLNMRLMNQGLAKNIQEEHNIPNWLMPIETPDVITEDYLQPDELDRLGNVIRNRRGTEGFTLNDDGPEGEVYNKPNKNMLHYTDYHKDKGAYKIQQASTVDKLTDKDLELSTSFGTSWITEDKDYYYLNDTYDFSFDQELYDKYKDSAKSDPYNYFRWVVLPQRVGDRDAQSKFDQTQRDPQKIKIKIPKKVKNKMIYNNVKL